MTNVLIRRLMRCGYTPDVACIICHAHMDDLSILESKISLMERADNVGVLQSIANRETSRRLFGSCRSKGVKY